MRRLHLFALVLLVLCLDCLQCGRLGVIRASLIKGHANYSQRDVLQSKRDSNEIVADRQVLTWIPNGVKNGIASGLSTVLVKLILQPFDTLKTVQQMHGQGLSIPAAARQVIKSRGLLGLWSGAIVSAVGATPSVALYFAVYSSLRQRLTSALPASQRLLAVGTASFFANSIASVLRVPYEVYKQRIQAGMYDNIAQAVVGSWRAEGILGIFGGGKLKSQIIRDVPYAIVTALTYDLLQRQLQQPDSALSVALRCLSRQMQDMVCGAAAGGLGSWVTTPMDVVKTRLMTSRAQRTSFAQTIQTMYREEGPGAFFIGVSSRLLHKIPANGLFFVFYEALRYLLGAVELRSAQ